MSDKIVAYNGIKPATVCRYDGVALGEVMLRFDPYDVPTALAREMRIFQGGAIHLCRACWLRCSRVRW